MFRTPLTDEIGLWRLQQVAEIAQDILGGKESYGRGAERLSQRLKDPPSGSPGSPPVDDPIEQQWHEYLAICQDILQAPPLRLEISMHQIRNRPSRFEMIEAKALFNCRMPRIIGNIGVPPYGMVPIPAPDTTNLPLQVTCGIASSRWNALRHLPGDTINLLDHLHLLLPTTKWASDQEAIGLVTFQNGIRNTLEDFRKMGQSIIYKIPPGVLSIGLHNPTRNLPSDMYRFTDEPHLNREGVFSLCLMARALAQTLSEKSRPLKWLHIAHSEGGLIANVFLELCQRQNEFKELSKLIKKRMMVATYGAVRPVPRDYVLDTLNTYSDKDIALFFGKKYLQKDPDKVQERPYESVKMVKGRTYAVTLVASQTLYDPLEGEEILFKQMTEYLEMKHPAGVQAAIELAESSTGFEMGIALNRMKHKIKDHGFIEASYQAVLETDIQDLKRRYRFYEVP